MTRSLRLIGLTGGIGSGKSSVARLVSARGIPVLDADQLARQATEPGRPALGRIAAAWPQAVSKDGRLDRRRLADIVFADAEARARLEGMLHPEIVALSEARAAALGAQGHAVAFYEASLLVETGRHRELDGLVVVDAPEPARVARVMARDGIPEDAVRTRIAAQRSMADKRAVATYVIDNDGDTEKLEASVTAMLHALEISV